MFPNSIQAEWPYWPYIKEWHTIVKVHSQNQVTFLFRVSSDPLNDIHSPLFTSPCFQSGAKVNCCMYVYMLAWAIHRLDNQCVDMNTGSRKGGGHCVCTSMAQLPHTCTWMCSQLHMYMYICMVHVCTCTCTCSLYIYTCSLYTCTCIHVYYMCIGRPSWVYLYILSLSFSCFSLVSLSL